MTNKTFRILLGAVAAVGLVIRASFVVFKTGREKLAGDAFYYFQQATSVADGHGFIQPTYALVNNSIVPATRTVVGGRGLVQPFGPFPSGIPVPGADHPPGFVSVLALLRTVGVTTPNGQRFAMCLLGTVTIILIGLLGKRLVNARFGLIAALLTAIYPQVWINDGMLMSETLYVFSLVVALSLVYAIWQRPSWPRAIGAAVAITLACSARPESALLFPFMLVPVVLARWQVPLVRRVGMLAVCAAIPVLIFLPWILYNQHRFAKPVYISTGLGQTLLAANCSLTYSGPFLGSFDGECTLPRYGGPPITKDASVNDLRFRKTAFRYMSDHKGELPKVILAREGRMWAVWRPSQQVLLDGWTEGRGSVTISRWAQWSYWLAAILALVGIPIWRKWRIPLYPLMLQVALTAFVAAMTFGVTRYRAGVEICIVLLASASIEWTIRRVRRSPSGRVDPAPPLSG